MKYTHKNTNKQDKQRTGISSELSHLITITRQKNSINSCFWDCWSDPGCFPSIFFHCLSFCFFWILNHFETWLFQTYVNYVLKLWKILKKQLKWVTLDKSVNFSQFLYNMGMIDLTFKIQLKDNSDYHLWQYNRLQFYS